MTRDSTFTIGTPASYLRLELNVLDMELRRLVCRVEYDRLGKVVNWSPIESAPVTRAMVFPEVTHRISHDKSAVLPMNVSIGSIRAGNSRPIVRWYMTSKGLGTPCAESERTADTIFTMTRMPTRAAVSINQAATTSISSDHSMDWRMAYITT